MHWEAKKIPVTHFIVISAVLPWSGTEPAALQGLPVFRIPFPFKFLSVLKSGHSFPAHCLHFLFL